MDMLRLGTSLALAALLLPSPALAQDAQKDAIARKLVRVFGEPLRGHAKGVTSVHYSPDGKSVLTAGAAGMLRLWSTTSGKLDRSIAAHQGYIHFASPYDAGAKIVSAGCDRSVGFFDARTGAELGRIRELPEKFERSMDYHSWQLTADGKYLLVEDPTYKATGILRIDLVNRAMAEPMELPGGSISRFALSPDGRYLALVERGRLLDNFLHLYDLNAEETVARVKAPYPNCLFFSADGARLFALGADVWQMWNGRTGELEGEPESLVDTPRAAAISPDKTRLYVGSSVEGKLVGVDLTARRVLFEWPEFVTEVLGVALSPDQKTVAAGSLDGSLRFFDATTGQEKLGSKGHHTRVTALALSADGTQMVTGSYDNEVMVWDVKRGKELARHREHEHYVMSAGYNAKGQPYSVGQDMKLKLLDPRTGKVTKTADLTAATPNAMGVAASPDGSLLVVSHYVEAKDEDEVSGKHVVWDLVTGEVKQTFATADVFNAQSLSGDGKRMAVLQRDRLALWSVGAKAADFVFTPQRTGYYGMALVGPDAAVTGDLDGKVMLWKKGTAEASKTAVVSRSEHVILDIAVSADAQRIFVAVADAVVIYDAELSELARITAFDSMPVSLAPSRDGKSLLCGMSDSTVLVWSLDKLLK